MHGPDGSMTDQAKELAGYFRAAAEQRRLLAPRRDDRKMLRENKTVIHAVDADVVMLFTDPFKNAVRSKRRPFGYGEVFPGEEPGTALGIGRALAHFIFFQLNLDGSMPLLLPPIDQELREVFSVVMRKAQGESDKARQQANAAQRVISRLNTTSDKKEQCRILTEAAPDLCQFLAGGQGAKAELMRFSNLLGEKRIVPLDQALDVNADWGDNNVFRDAFQPPRELAGRLKLLGLERAWSNRIHETAPKNKREDRIQDDAIMLARLEWINRKLGHDARLVLITGDNSIHGAARNYVPPEHHLNFADCFLRHPRAYLAEPEVLSPKKKTTEDVETAFLNWLDVFIRKFKNAGSEYLAELDQMREETGQLEKVANAVLKSDKGIMDEFKAQWVGYAKPVTLKFSSSSHSNIDDSETIKDLIESLTKRLGSVKELLDEECEKTWKAFFDTGLMAGFLFRRQWNVPRRPRNPPVLSFESFKKARSILKKILQTAPEQPIADFSKFKGILYGEDPSGYALNLVFGELSAAQRSWANAAILACRALEIVNDNPDTCDNNNITGREAWYLLAVAKRHLAKRMDQLKEVSGYLKKAANCLKRDREQRPDLLKSDLRFAAEEGALNISYRLFERFRNEMIPDNVLSFNQIQSELMKLLDSNISDLDSNEEEKKWIALNVERKLLTNLFTVSLLMAKREHPFPEALKNYLSRFKVSASFNPKSELDIPSTYLVDAVFDVSSWWHEQDSSKRKKLRIKVITNLSDQKIKNNSVMVYDKTRFEYLRSFVDPRL